MKERFSQFEILSKKDIEKIRRNAFEEGNAQGRAAYIKLVNYVNGYISRLQEQPDKKGDALYILKNLLK